MTVYTRASCGGKTSISGVCGLRSQVSGLRLGKKHLCPLDHLAPPPLKSRLFTAGTSTLTVPRGENCILLKENIPSRPPLTGDPRQAAASPHFTVTQPPLWGGAPVPPRLCLPVQTRKALLSM